MTIITIPRRYAERPATRGSTVANEKVLLLSEAGRRLLSAVERAAGQGDGCELAVAALLRHGLATPDALASLPWHEEMKHRPARLDLARTRAFQIFARRWQPGQVGPLRLFLDWFAYGVVEGSLVELGNAEGQGFDHAGAAGGILPVPRRHDLSRGEVRHGPGDGRRLRRLGNLSAEIAVSLHVEALPQMPIATRSVVMPVPAHPEPAPRPRPRLTAIPGGRRG